MVLGKLPVPGASYNLDYSRARAYCTYSRCGYGLFGHFYSRLSILSSFSLSLGAARYRLKLLFSRERKFHGFQPYQMTKFMKPAVYKSVNFLIRPVCSVILIYDCSQLTTWR